MYKYDILTSIVIVGKDQNALNQQRVIHWSTTINEILVSYS